LLCLMCPLKQYLIFLAAASLEIERVISQIDAPMRWTLAL
jgi:hypothetical protein